MTGRTARDGGVSSIEWALLTPVLLFVIGLTIQFTLVYHAHQVALAAAQFGARTARTDTSGNWKVHTTDAVNAAATQVGGNGLLHDIHVSFPKDKSGSDGRWVSVRGAVSEVFPGITLHVTERAGGPIECFRPDQASDGNELGARCK